MKNKIPFCVDEESLLQLPWVHHQVWRNLSLITRLFPLFPGVRGGEEPGGRQPCARNEHVPGSRLDESMMLLNRV